jgi:uncharacterized membrane protein (Fun14 family)
MKVYLCLMRVYLIGFKFLNQPGVWNIHDEPTFESVKPNTTKTYNKRESEPIET